VVNAVDIETTPVGSVRQRVSYRTAIPSHRGNGNLLLAQSTAQSPHTSDHADEPPKKVRILPPVSGRFDRSRRSRLDSAKTFRNLVLETACRKTDEFPVPVRAALIGGLMAIPEKV
jgi:hypothetical protein